MEEKTKILLGDHGERVKKQRGGVAQIPEIKNEGIT